MPPVLIWLLVLVVVSAFATALGSVALRLLRLRAASTVEHGVVAALLGLGLWQYAPWALWAGGIGHPATVRHATLALCALLAPASLGVARATGRALVAWLRTWAGRRARWLLLAEAVVALCVVVGLGCAFIRAVCPATHADALGYHLPAAQAHLRTGRFTFISTMPYTAWPLGVQSLYAVMMAFDWNAPVGIVHFLFGVVTLVGTWAFAARTMGRAAGILAAGSLAATHSFTRLLWYAYVDLAVAAFALGAAMALAQSRRRRWLVVASVLAAFAVNAKLSGLWVLAAVAVAVCLDPPFANRPDAARRARAAAIVAGIALVAIGPWMARTWAITGNPFHPLFSQFIPTREWSPEAMGRLRRMFLLFGSPPGLPHGPATLYATRAVLAAAALGLAWLVTRLTRAFAAAPPIRVASYTLCGIVAGVGPYGRYFLPCAPGAAVGVAAVGRRLGGMAAIAGIMLAAVGARSMVRDIQPTLGAALPYAIGAIGSDAYLRSQVTEYDLIRFCNRRLPRRSLLLVVGSFDDHIGLYHVRAVRGDPWTQDAFRYDTLEQLRTDLAREGVTHIAVAPVERDMAGSRVYMERVNKEIAMVLRAIGDARPLYETKGWRLFRYAPQGTRAPRSTLVSWVAPPTPPRTPCSVRQRACPWPGVHEPRHAGPPAIPVFRWES